MAGQRVISAVLTLRDKNFGSTAGKAANSTKDLERRVKSTGNAVSRFGKSATSSFASVAKSALGLAAAYVGINAVKNLGVSMIEAAATAKATASQFEQVFSGMESAAETSLTKVANETGILSERLKGSFIGMAAFAKTTGMDTAGSLKLAERATLAAADGAAFMDKSIESVTESLQSFLKGNFANDAALGISATETTRNAAANKLYGTSFKKLSEEQKQLTLLQMVEDGNKLSGAMGQAARETDGFENVLGNLRSSWDTLKAKFGVPILEPAVKGMQALSTWIGNVNTDSIVAGFYKFGSVVKGVFEQAQPGLAWLKDTALPAVRDKFVEIYTAAQPGLNWLKDTALPAVVDGLGFVVGKATEVYNFITGNWGAIGPIVAGVAATIATLKIGILATTVATKAWAIGTTAVQLATALLNGTLAISPLGWVALAIGAVVAAGVLLYKNWDTVKEAAQSLWDKLKIVWTAVQAGFSVAWDMVKSAAGNALNFIIEKVNGVIGLLNKMPGVDIKAVGTVDWGKESMPQYATGTSYAPGGLARINEGGRGEIVDLPNGSRVYPHDKSVQMARSEGKGISFGDINIHGSNMTVDDVVNELVPKLKLRLANI